MGPRAMEDDPLHSVLRDAERQVFRFTFEDGEEMLAEVISSTHVDADDTVVLLRAGASPLDPAHSVQLAEIRSLVVPGGRLLYKRA